MNCKKSILSLGWYHEVYHNFSTPTPRIKMQLQTILNRVEKQKGFVYSKARFNENGELEVELCPRRNSKAICSVGFLQDHWHYPLIMVLGAFVAGLTPEGGGAVAFPVLSVFFNIDRILARDFSLMIQSVGMTSASIFILTQKGINRRVFRPLLWMLPVVCAGFVLGMLTLQTIPVYLIQALFLSMITAFAFSYAWGDHRGTKQSLCLESSWDVFFIGLILLLGGLCANLFGTGADILLYSLLVTRFRMSEKNATRICIMLMAGTSVFGFGYRHVIEAGLQADQYKTWICAYPVVLFMAPFGALVLSKINVEWMIKGTTSPDASSQPCGPDEPSTANLPHTDQGEIAV